MCVCKETRRCWSLQGCIASMVHVKQVKLHAKNEMSLLSIGVQCKIQLFLGVFCCWFGFFSLHRHCCNTFAEIQSHHDPLVPRALGERRLPAWCYFLIPVPWFSGTVNSYKTENIHVNDCCGKSSCQNLWGFEGLFLSCILALVLPCAALCEIRPMLEL